MGRKDRNGPQSADAPMAGDRLVFAHVSLDAQDQIEGKKEFLEDTQLYVQRLLHSVSGKAAISEPPQLQGIQL